MIPAPTMTTSAPLSAKFDPSLPLLQSRIEHAKGHGVNNGNRQGSAERARLRRGSFARPHHENFCCFCGCFRRKMKSKSIGMLTLLLSLIASNAIALAAPTSDESAV